MEVVRFVKMALVVWMVGVLNLHFWCRGYYVDTVVKNKKRIEEYIRHLLQEDIATDQMNLFETTDLFTLEKYKRK